MSLRSIFALSTALCTVREIALVCARDAISGTTPPKRICSVHEEEISDERISRPFFTIAAAVSSQDDSIARMTEELTRLKSHISQLRTILSGEKDAGKKLDFLMQEFNRETNTVCSKANDADITKIGLALKNEIEKMREQVQNIE